MLSRLSNVLVWGPSRGSRGRFDRSPARRLTEWNKPTSNVREPLNCTNGSEFSFDNLWATFVISCPVRYPCLHCCKYRYNASMRWPKPSSYVHVRTGSVALFALGSVTSPINARDASACASAFADRNAPPPLPRGVGFLHELTPASSLPAVPREPVVPWRSPRAA